VAIGWVLNNIWGVPLFDVTVRTFPPLSCAWLGGDAPQVQYLTRGRHPRSPAAAGGCFLAVPRSRIVSERPANQRAYASWLVDARRSPVTTVTMSRRTRGAIQQARDSSRLAEKLPAHGQKRSSAQGSGGASTMRDQSRPTSRNGPAQQVYRRVR